MKNVLLVLLATSLPLTLLAQTQLPPASATKVDYEKDVQPILAQNCYSCHGDAVQQSGLRLDRRQLALRGGDYGPVIVPGKSADSKLIRRLVHGDGGMQMPPTGPLSIDEIGILRAWIDQGADFRNDVVDEALPQPIDPQLARMIAAVRGHDQVAVERLIVENPGIVKSRDAAGSTLLHHAAGFGSLEMLTSLVKHGAGIDAKNRRGSTALHWAIHDSSKVGTLLAHGAAVNARQAEGRTPLMLAASLGNGIPTLRLLLEHGADPNIAMANGQTPLMAAATRGDTDALRLLIEKKAIVDAKNGAGETALLLASSDGNPRAVALLLDHGADARVRTKRNETALGNAATAGVDETVRLLLDHGADVNVRNIRGYSPLMLAASSDAMPAASVKRLLASGADRTYTADYDETARDLAAKRGNTAVTRLLGPTVPTAAAPTPLHSGTRPSIPVAVERALSLLERQSHDFIRIGGCNSCHSQDLPSAAAALARSRGLRAPREIPQLPASMLPSAERLMDFNVVAVTGIAWELFDFGMNRVPSSAYTDAAVRLIKATQTSDGNWNSNESRRPPMNAGAFQAAALSIFALKHYAPATERAGTEQAIAKASEWLQRARPQTTQDVAFHALGLAWAGGSEAARTAARALVSLQRSDGGWSQLPGLASDAYATGQALYGLKLAGGMASTDPIYQKGVEYLLRTQAADGSWQVKSRSIWLQPYFESGFPYGRDQFISAAGTAWASMALTLATEMQTTTQR